ncbi:MAG TPA: hypothetical protein VHE53_02565, partial [Patescibacteria group bacterium]|nr:hypothetical protein [Patescibacteria group bacterium]
SSQNQTNIGKVDNDVDSVADTGNNTASQAGAIATPSATPTNNSNNISSTGLTTSSGSSASITTGDATSLVIGENDVNTNNVNSKIIYHTVNLFVNQNGDLDLSDPFTIAQNIVTSEQDTNGGTVNVMATSTDNYAYVDNNMVSIANTGENTVKGSMEATIHTGNSYSVMSLLNQVNFTVIGSEIHIVTINIFGDLTGNIILPEYSALEACSSCGMSVSQTNIATVDNNITSVANSGNNDINAASTSAITTGDSQSAVNVTNLINMNIIGMLLYNLQINVFGKWDGNFLGIGNIFGQYGPGDLWFNYASSGAGSGCQSCVGDVNSYNEAHVVNNLGSVSNSGDNNIDSATNGSIKTGNAFSAISLTNFINTNFINSIGFFGFINIFGNLTGNIGGKSHIAAAEAAQNSHDSNNSVQIADETREDGGQLLVTNTNNVGTHVKPGDTVTFFMDVKNIGTGKVYEGKLYLYLVNSKGQGVGGTVFDIGAIKPGKKITVSTGLVLSPNTPEGVYTAVAEADAVTGPQNSSLTASATSSFLVDDGLPNGLVLNNATPKTPEPKVLGATTTKVASQNNTANNASLAFLFFGLMGTYLLIRLIKKREYVYELFTKGVSFKERVYSLRLFLL